jgi:hypothetical protein
MDELSLALADMGGAGRITCLPVFQLLKKMTGIFRKFLEIFPEGSPDIPKNFLRKKFHAPPPAAVPAPGFSFTARGCPSRPISSSHESSTRKNRSVPAFE